jgi:hypothetical protein
MVDAEVLSLIVTEIVPLNVSEVGEKVGVATVAIKV